MFVPLGKLELHLGYERGMCLEKYCHPRIYPIQKEIEPVTYGAIYIVWINPCVEFLIDNLVHNCASIQYVQVI